MANTKIQSEQIADLAIVTDRIAADAVTTAKIADNVALGGSPTTTTQSASDNSTKIATTEYVTSAISSLIDSAPSTLNTLNEIAAALNDDANFNTTVTNSIAAKLPLAGGTMTGAINMGANQITNSGKITSTELTITGGSDGADLYINNSSPTLGFTDSNSFSDSSDIYIVRGGSTGDLLFQFFDDSANSTTTTFQIDETGNTTIAGTISSGAIASSASITASGNSNNFGNTTIAALSATSGTFSGSITASGNSNSFGNSSFGTISSGAITSTGTVTGTQLKAATASTTAAVLKLEDTGVATYDVSFPDTGTMLLGVNDQSGTTSNKVLKLHNAGSGTLGLSVEGASTFIGRVQPHEHLIFQSATGYLQFPAASSRAWAIASQGGTAAPGTSSATFGFHHWSGSAWSNPINITASGKLAVGTDNPDAELHIFNSDSGATATSNSVAVFEGNDNTEISILGGSSSVLALNFGHSGDNNDGILTYNTTSGSEQMDFYVNAASRMLIDKDGRVGINRTPAVSNSKLEVGGADNVPLINVEASGATAGVGIGSSRMKFYYGTSEKMSLDSNGNLRTSRQVIQENSDGTPRFINIPYSSAGSGFTFDFMDLSNHSAVGDQASETNAFMFEVNVTSYLFRYVKALIIVDTNADNSLSVVTLSNSTLTLSASIPTNSTNITVTISNLWANAVNYMGRITTF